MAFTLLVILVSTMHYQLLSAILLYKLVASYDSISTAHRSHEVFWPMFYSFFLYIVQEYANQVGLAHTLTYYGMVGLYLNWVVTCFKENDDHPALGQE
jgi:hypothetical protein